MRHFLLTAAVLSLLIVLAPLSASAGRNLSLYLDGALVEQQEGASRGYIQFSLPTAALPDSLRIRPGRGTAITRVMTTPLKPAPATARELQELTDREELLQDRLKALAVREEIFKSAAKSQSAKAPRRTRTNPEPLATIRQGTDYAIAQLESVYQAKRKASKELARLVERRSRLQKDESVAGTVVKVWVTPATGKVTASWLQTDRFWKPDYQLQVAEVGEAALVLHGNGVTLAKGESATLYLSALKSAVSAGFAYSGEAVPLRRIPVQCTNLHGGPPDSPLSLSLVNTSGINLPAGDAACYQAGAYLGKAMFKGAESGKSVELVCNGI